MLGQTVAHALVVLTVAIFWPSKVSVQKSEAFVVLGIASAAAIEEVQAQPLAFMVSAEHHCGCQHAVDWPALKLEETGVSLLKK